MNIKKFTSPLLVLLSLVLSYFAGYFPGRVYTFLHPGIGGGSFLVPTNAAAFILGWPLAFVFFISLLFTIFGGPKKKWWIGILSAPVAILWIFGDIVTIYFPIAMGLLGWGLGLGVEKLVAKLKKPNQV